MKLRSCHIDNFGKLSDLHLEFQDGVNLFHEPNAWGKSTLAAFLRVMFYGFDSKRESGLFDKERVVFRPWQGGTYGGELDFSYQGKEYRISRTFGKTEKTDSNGLINLSNLNIESAGKVYTVKIHETKAPTGYIAGADVTFTAESQDNSAKTGYELKPVTKTGVSGSEVTITNTMITVLIKNTQKVGSYAVNLVKVDKQGHIISKEVSKFTINGEDAETSNGYLRVASAKEITKDGQIDTYKIVETEAPKGYEKYLQEIALTVVGQETSNGYAIDTRKN